MKTYRIVFHVENVNILVYPFRTQNNTEFLKRTVILSFKKCVKAPTTLRGIQNYTETTALFPKCDEFFPKP